MAAIYQNINGSAVKLKKIYQKIGGSAVELKKIYQKINGSEVELFSSAMAWTEAISGSGYPSLDVSNAGYTFIAINSDSTSGYNESLYCNFIDSPVLSSGSTIKLEVGPYTTSGSYNGITSVWINSTEVIDIDAAQTITYTLTSDFTLSYIRIMQGCNASENYSYAKVTVTPSGESAFLLNNSGTSEQ
jgi:hypothetical protein